MPAGEIKRSGLVYTDRVTIVTGGAKGIGEGCVRVFVDAGAKVVMCDKDVETGASLMKEVNANGPGSCDFIQADVSKPDDVKRLIDHAVELHSRIDCLINNAGFHPPHKTIDDFSVEELMDVIQTNLIGLFVACKYALPYIRKTKGSIINMSSLVAHIGQEGATTYCATKGGISAMTKALAIEEARYGVRVNAVLPGNILSDSRVKGVAALPEDIREGIEEWLDANQHIGRSGYSEEVAQLCLFLASDAASYISGTDSIISWGAELGYGVKYPVLFIK